MNQGVWQVLSPFPTLTCSIQDYQQGKDTHPSYLICRPYHTR